MEATQSNALYRLRKISIVLSTLSRDHAYNGERGTSHTRSGACGRRRHRMLPFSFLLLAELRSRWYLVLKSYDRFISLIQPPSQRNHDVALFEHELLVPIHLQCPNLLF